MKRTLAIFVVLILTIPVAILSTNSSNRDLAMDDSTVTDADTSSPVTDESYTGSCIMSDIQIPQAPAKEPAGATRSVLEPLTEDLDESMEPGSTTSFTAASYPPKGTTGMDRDRSTGLDVREPPNMVQETEIILNGLPEKVYSNEAVTVSGILKEIDTAEVNGSGIPYAPVYIYDDLEEMSSGKVMTDSGGKFSYTFDQARDLVGPFGFFAVFRGQWITPNGTYYEAPQDGSPPQVVVKVIESGGNGTGNGTGNSTVEYQTVDITTIAGAFYARLAFDGTIVTDSWVWTEVWHRTELNLSMDSAARVFPGGQVRVSGTLEDTTNGDGLSGFTLSVSIRFTTDTGDKLVKLAENLVTESLGRFEIEYTLPENVSVGPQWIEVNFNPDEFTTNQFYEASQSRARINVIHYAFPEIISMGDDPLYLTQQITIRGRILDKDGSPVHTSFDGTDHREHFYLYYFWETAASEIGGTPITQIDGSGEFYFTLTVTSKNNQPGMKKLEIMLDFNSDTFYEPWSGNDVASENFEVRAHTEIELNVAQKYVTRVPFQANESTIDYNNVHLVGKLMIKETRKGVPTLPVTINWDVSTEWTEEETVSTNSDPYAGEFEKDFSVNENHDLKVIRVIAAFNPPEDSFYDPTEVELEVQVVAMTYITLYPGSLIKGSPEDSIIRGKLEDDRFSPLNDFDVHLYWKQDLSSIYQPVPLGVVETNSMGEFQFMYNSTLIQTVGRIYILAQFKGKDMAEVGGGVFIGDTREPSNVPGTEWVEYTIKARTKVALDSAVSSHSGGRFVRGHRFSVTGIISEDIRNSESSARLPGISGVEMHISVGGISSEQKSESGKDGYFSLSEVLIPNSVNPGLVQINVSFQGSDFYLPSSVVITKTVVAETEIVVSTYQEDIYQIIDGKPVEGQDGRPDLMEHNEEQGENTLIVFLGERNPSGTAVGIEEVNITIIIRSFDNQYRNVTRLTIPYQSGGVIQFSFVELLDTKRVEFFGNLQTTSWGQKWRQAQNVYVTVQFEGDEYYLPANITTEMNYFPDISHLEEPKTDWQQIMLLVVIPAIVIFLVALFFMLWWHKQQRIRGLRRIIKRAADQLVAGNEYTAVIFKSYQRLSIHLRKYGYLRREAETFREFEDAIRQALPVDKQSLNAFLHLLEEARYSKHAIGHSQRNDAINHLRRIEESLSQIILDEDAALKAMASLEEDEYVETEILVNDGKK